MQKYLRLLLTAILTATISQGVLAAELLTNGGFETGDLTGWTFTNAPNSYQSWISAPAGYDTGFHISSPQQGTRSALNGVTSTTNGSPFILFQQFSLPAGTSSTSWRHRFQVDNASFCSPCGSATASVLLTNTSNTTVQTLYTYTCPANAVCDTGWVTGYSRLDSHAGQSRRIRFVSSMAVANGGPGMFEVDAVSVQAPAVASAANASISGRVTSENGRPLGKTKVTISDAEGNTKTVMTNPFGYYNFDDLRTGATYMVSVVSKGIIFTNSPRPVSLTDDISDLNFMGSPVPE